MAAAREDVHALRAGRGLEQGPALRERDDVVTVAVKDQERNAQPVDAAVPPVIVQLMPPEEGAIIGGNVVPVPVTPLEQLNVLE